LGGRLGQQVPQFAISAALNRAPRLLHFERRAQARIAVNHRQRRTLMTLTRRIFVGAGNVIRASDKGG